jgi:hypothetical protein
MSRKKRLVASALAAVSAVPATLAAWQVLAGSPIGKLLALGNALALIF